MRWFAVSVGLDSHPKTFDLRWRLKDKKAEVYVLRLMSWLAQTENEAGAFQEPLMAEEVARWTGKAGALVEALVASGFLEKHQGSYIVHGWSKWNGPHLRKARKDRIDTPEESALESRGNLADSAPTYLPTDRPTELTPPTPPAGGLKLRPRALEKIAQEKAKEAQADIHDQRIDWDTRRRAMDRPFFDQHGRIPTDQEATKVLGCRP